VNILALGAHPDDLELMAGGTLRRCVLRGDEVTMACLTNGNMGHVEIAPEELAEIRKEEARCASEIIGARFEWLDFPDEWLMHEDEAARKTVVNVLRKHQPEVVITHAANDYHPDHRAAYDLVFAASFLATVPHIGSDYPAVKKVPELYLMDTLGGLGSSPVYYVDVSDVYEVKKRALEQHQSQLKWMKDHDGIDFADWMRVIAEYRGLQAGVRFAEGFAQERRWPGLSTERRLP
jgi:LmbE family N-acetylglucosaminyl deacetylase